LENFEIDDPRIGFLKQQTIFDVLTRHGIDWKVFESDLSLIRMFDNFRLDDRHVIPLDDPKDGLDATLFSGGPLPRVIFVEPNFTDIPPLATANDDLPPADLAAGQEFIARVCDAIWSSGHFADCLVCITYDEHGGFYDHVPPPGTLVAEGGDPRNAGQKPKLHPKGPGYLGVRVPTLIISPYVSAHKAARTEFDHTSILKTILVHNRERLPSSVMGSFGARVNAAAHLGQVLDYPSPRQPPFQPFDKLRPLPTTRVHGEISGTGGAMATGTALGGAAEPAPIPPRTVKILRRSGSLASESDDPQDFHAALRNVLKPRR
jgi:phospholipase C